MKYFYTDPLKALWMLQEFQIQFFCVIFEVGIPAPLEENEIRGMIYQSHNARLYIHPDCLEIFKPQIGDVVMTASNEAYLIKGDCLHILTEIYPDDYQTIQRNGKAFFMPEIEK